MPRRAICLLPTSLLLLAGLLQAQHDGTTTEDTALTTGRGTLRGKATLEGAWPDLDKLNTEYREALGQRDRDCCLGGRGTELEQQQWRLSKDGEVANVVVWLRTLDGEPFHLEKRDLNPERSGWPKEVVLDAPHCTFEPHVAVLFPKYRERGTGKLVETGQVLRLRNSSSVAHNHHVTGGDQPGLNRIATPHDEAGVTFLAEPNTRAFCVQCDVHPWTRSYFRAFDHPFAAVTDRYGNFEIKNVPAGLQRLVAWHEETGYIPERAKTGRVIEIAPDRTTTVSLHLRVPRE